MGLSFCLCPPEAGSLVLRVHQPDGCVSRPRLLALQEVRRRLAEGGLRVPVSAAFATPGSLRRRLPVTEAAVWEDPAAVDPFNHLTKPQIRAARVHRHLR